MNLVIIAAIGDNYELGRNNDLIWRFKSDMKFFRDATMGKVIVMGRKTLESLPGLLSGRRHVVLTRNDMVRDGVLFVHSKEELYEIFKDYPDDIMIIGGYSIYKMFIDDVNEMLLTEIHDTCLDADVYFPSFDKNDWERNVISENIERGISFEHVSYTRKRIKK